MTCDRCYQGARTRAQAIEELRRHAGTQFDPRVVQSIIRALETPAQSTPPAHRGTSTR
jgi:HD-GYP domain-containing protein (c-di-GMP phosphodiesterase class II)